MTLPRSFILLALIGAIGVGCKGGVKLKGGGGNGGSTPDPCGNLALLCSPLPKVSGELTVTAPGAFINAASNSATFPVSGNCTEAGGSLVTVQFDDQPAPGQVGGTCDGAQWQATVDTTALSEGGHTLKAVMNDTVASEALSITKDTVAPSLTLAAADPMVRPGDAVDLAVSMSDQGSGLKSASQSLALDGAAFAAPAELASTATATNVVIPSDAGSTAAAKIKVRIEDAAGNAAEQTTAAFQVVTEVKSIISAFRLANGHADGAAEKARFANPAGLATDGTYVYVGDFRFIRRIRISDGTTDTVAGLPHLGGTADGQGSAARFNGSANALTYLNGALYVVDNNTVRKIVVTSGTDYGTVTTFPEVYSNPGGLTHDGTDLYLSVYLGASGWGIKKIEPTSGTAVDFATGLNTPQGLVYHAGNLYFFSNATCDIRKLTVPGAVMSIFSGNDGSGNTYCGSVDGNANTARFLRAQQLATDGSFLYFGEYVHNSIRRVSLTDGSAELIAGDPKTPGYANGSGVDARFISPWGIVSVNGSLYVSDLQNYGIRKVVPGASAALTTVSQFAGPDLSEAGFDRFESTENGPNAKLGEMTGLTTLDGDTFYVATGYQQTLRKIKLSDNLVTTVAGSFGKEGVTASPVAAAAARFRNPQGVVQCGTDVYVADEENFVIRKLDAGGTVTTIAGTGVKAHSDNATGTSAQLTKPYGLARNAACTELYFTDGHRIRRITLGGSNAVDTIAGAGSVGSDDGTSAKFRNPKHLLVHEFVDGSLVQHQHIYVADGTNQTIRLIDMTGFTPPYTTYTVAGAVGVAGLADGTGAAANFSEPRGLAKLGNTLYVADYNNSRIRAVNVSTCPAANCGTVTTVAGGGSGNNYWDGNGLTASIGSPRNLALSGTSLYITTDIQGIRKFDTTTGQVRTIAALSTNNRGSGRLINGGSDGPVLAASSEHQIQSGVVYQGKIIASDHNFVMRKMDLDGGNSVIVAGAPGESDSVDGVGTAARISRTGKLVLAGDYVYFTESTLGTIRRMRLSDYSIETIAGTAGQDGHADGTGSAAKFLLPNNVAVVGENIYVSEANGHTIRKVSLASGHFGETTTLAGSSGVTGSDDGVGASARFNNPAAMIHVGGHLYVSDHLNGTIRKIDPATGEVTTFAGKAGEFDNVDGIGTAARFVMPNDLITDGVNLYVFDRSTSLIRKIRIADAKVSTFAGLPYARRDDPTGSIATTAVHGYFGTVYVPGTGLYKFASPGGFLIH